MSTIYEEYPLPLTSHPDSPQLADVPQDTTSRDGKAVLGFLLFMLGCRVALLVPALAGFRIFWRIGPFAASIMMFLVYHRRLVNMHPARQFVAVALGILALAQLHPDTNRISGLAELAFLSAIALPVFWCGATGVRSTTFRWLLGIFWAYNSLSALFGVLQVRYPGRFLPNLSSNFSGFSEDALGALKVTLSSGVSVFRPLGLSDNPGGAAVASIYAILFGLGTFITARRMWIRLLGAASMMLGMFCIYLSYIRAMLAVSIVCTAIYLLMLARRKDIARLSSAIILVTAVGFASFFWALSYGGEGMINRFKTLVTESPTQVYYTSRGRFVEDTIFHLIPTYPLGAGAGRFGMMYTYFGDKSLQSLWAEVQLPAWVLDGGVPLALFYSLALFITLRVAYKIARHAPTRDIGLWGTLIFAYDIGIVADMFGNPTFNSETGMEFWILNAALFAVYQSALAEQPQIEYAADHLPDYATPQEFAS